MYHPAKADFIDLARGANLIPVSRDIIADMDTPVSALRKLGSGDCAYLLESVEGGEKIGRYSFLGNSALFTFTSRGRTVTVRQGGTGGEAKSFEAPDPLAALREVLRQYRPAQVGGLPRFYGGAVGYLAYDVIRFFERLPNGKPDDLGLPDTYFVLTDTVLIFDHVKRKIKIVVNAVVDGDPGKAYDAAVAKIDAVLARLLGEPGIRPLAGLPAAANAMPYRSNVRREDFLSAVERCKAYIRAGDIFQAVLSQRLSARVAADPFDIYRVLRSINPSPYMYYLHLGDLHVVGSSPEVMVRCEQGVAQLRPIAGTRPRGTSEAEDEALAEELLADAKERAEHIMLVDLGRNDLGRVCQYGTVRVDELMAIERYSHVMHIVSNVVGRLRPDKDPFDLLRATFPAGTVSGAPKIRAMEIIDELEPTRRGVYAGAIAYFGFSGNMDSCITIRTIVIKDGWAHVQAGAGIVADSDAEREYQETLNKARALLAALALAEEVVACC